MIKLIKNIKIYYLIALLIASAFFTAFSLRLNNVGMVELRNEVIKIDEETGDLKEIEPALEELRSYILSHMNAEMPQPLELPGAYSKAVERVRKEAERSGTVNAKVYADAQRVCEDPNLVLSLRAQCIQDYVTRNASPGSDPAELKFPPKELYTYDFISPRWSFDLAGISIIVTGLLSIALLIKVWFYIYAYINKVIDRDPLE